ncbi:hypothetical protein Tco_1159767, partial [Tanacetum coccineum]
MAPLPHRDLRHPWLRYQVEGYDEGIVQNYKQRLETIWGRSVNQIHVLNFTGLTKGMRQTLGDRLSMIYTGDDRQALFTSHAWRRLFEIRGPLVREFIVEFLSTCRMSDMEMGLDGSERVIPEKRDLRDYKIEISSDRDFLGPASFYVFIRDPVRRLCHRMIDCSISSRGPAPKKYLFRHAEGRKSGARLSVGYFIGRLAALGLVSDQGLRGLLVAWVAPGLERQQAAPASAPGAAKDAHVVDEGAQAILAPIQAPQPLPLTPQHRTITQRINRLKEEMREL